MRISDWSSDVCSSDLFLARPHLGVKRVGFLGGEHELHRALGHAFFGDEGVVGGGEDIDDRIADRDDVIGGVGHAILHEDRYLSARVRAVGRPEEHTSELQSLMPISYAVFCLKAKNQNIILT